MSMIFIVIKWSMGALVPNQAIVKPKTTYHADSNIDTQ